MPEPIEKTRYIPFRKRDVVEMILDDGGLRNSEEREKFGKVCGITESIFHFEFHTILERLKDVPLKDLEILFPNSKIVMSLKDKLLLEIPAVAGGVPLLATKVIPALVVAFLVISAYFQESCK